MEFARSSSKREAWSLFIAVLTKAVLIIILFWLYNTLQSLSIGLALFLIKASCATIFLLYQRPLTSGGKLTKRQWFRVFQISILSLIVSGIWLTGLSLCGGLRTVLLWEHSDIALLSVINALLAFGSHSKSRGAVLFVLGIVTMLLFDNDQLIPTKDHPEGDHSGTLVHIIFWLLSLLGVPDHKGGAILLLISSLLALVLRGSQRRLAIDIGGAKRLQALEHLVQALCLLPLGVVGFLTSPTPSLNAWACLAVFALCYVVNFYADSVAKQHTDSSRLAALSTLASISVSVGVSVYLEYHAPLARHGLSVGVVLAAMLLLLATIFLTRSSQSSQGLLIGYSASGLPLYSTQQQAPPTTINWIRPLISQILDNPDSRRIFYFLLLNLAFTGVEMVYGVWTNSLGLISDGFHMLFDCTALLVGLTAAVMSHWKPTRLYSFGYGRVELLSGFVNGLFLVVIAGFVLFEALGRLVDPPEIKTERLLFVSVAGFIVNLIGVMSFHSHSGHTHGHSHGHSHGHAHGHSHGHAHGHSHGHAHGHSHGHAHGHSHDHTHCHHSNANMQGIFLHVLADTLGSVGVIISSLLIQQFGWLIADPICSLFIAVLIVISVIPLLKSSATNLMLATPSESIVQDTLDKLPLLDGVLSQSDAHFWQQSSTQVIGTLHVQVAPSASEQKTVHMIAQLLRDRGLTLLTAQVEKPAFVQNNQRISYVQRHRSATQPHVYVDCGPYVIKDV